MKSIITFVSFVGAIIPRSQIDKLKKGETEVYAQTTCHLQGDYESLRQLAKQLLGVDLNDLKK